MDMYCPTCRAMFVGTSRCPRCAGELRPPEDPPTPHAENDSLPQTIPQVSLAHRFVVGVIIAAAANVGCQLICDGVLQLNAIPPESWRHSPTGMLVLFGLQTFSVALGALVAGAAGERGFTLGFFLGGLVGAFFLAAEILAGTPPEFLSTYVQPLLLATLGGIAGAASARIWPPPPDVSCPLPVPKTLSSVKLLVSTPAKSADRPTAWLRVALGMAIMTAGVLLADEIRMTIQRSATGLFRFHSVGQGRFVSFQLATLAVLVGGMVAGAGTGAGLRHGLYASLPAATVVVANMLLRNRELPAPITYTLDLLNISPEPLSSAALAVGCSLILLGIAGGWLGGQLFLPLAPPHMRQRFRLID